MAFPTLYPWGNADPNSPRQRSVKLREYAQHMMKYKDGRFGRHPRWRFLIFNMIMREEVRKTSRLFVSRNSDLKDLDIDELKELLETDETTLPRMSELVWRGFLAHASKSTRRRPIWTEYFSFLLSQISSNLKKLVYFCGNGNAESVHQFYFSIRLHLQKLFRDL